VQDVVRFQIALPGTGDIANGSVVVSPDGRSVAFIALGPSGTAQLWVRSLDALDARPLTAVDAGLVREFWSPDSRSIAFAADGKLKVIHASGGPVQSLCNIQSHLVGGAWSRKGVILFGTTGHGLMSVPEGGGTPTRVTPDVTRDEVFHGFPAFLPDQQHFLYARTKGGPQGGIYLGSLDVPPAEQSSTPLMIGSGGPVYVPSPDSDVGSVLYVREGALVAQPFDSHALALKGQAAPLADDLGVGFSYSASTTGVLAYRPGTATNRQLAWFDRDGKALETVSDLGEYNVVALSPDGSHAVVGRRVQGNPDLWVDDFVRGTSTPLTRDPADDSFGVWSPLGDRIIFSSARRGSLDLYETAASGPDQDKVLLQSDDPKFAQDWSHNGRFLLYSTRKAGRGGDITSDLMNLSILPLDGTHDSLPYVTDEGYASQARFSPDDRFVAYTSNRSGRFEVYVRPFRESSRTQWQVSNQGGTQPRWSHDGRELFYVSLDGHMMAVPVLTTPDFQPGRPSVLFSAPIAALVGPPTNVTRYDVTPDGKKFLINAVPSRATGAEIPITVVLNWPQLLKSK
jgi:Tol biopolymer transport system component